MSKKEQIATFSNSQLDKLRKIIIKLVDAESLDDAKALVPELNSIIPKIEIEVDRMEEDKKEEIVEEPKIEEKVEEVKEEVIEEPKEPVKESEVKSDGGEEIKEEVSDEKVEEVKPEEPVVEVSKPEEPIVEEPPKVEEPVVVEGEKKEGEFSNDLSVLQAAYDALEEAQVKIAKFSEENEVLKTENEELKAKAVELDAIKDEVAKVEEKEKEAQFSKIAKDYIKVHGLKETEIDKVKEQIATFSESHREMLVKSIDKLKDTDKVPLVETKNSAQFSKTETVDSDTSKEIKDVKWDRFDKLRAMFACAKTAQANGREVNADMPLNY